MERERRAARSVFARLAIASFVSGCAASGAGRVYVANMDGHTISVIDVASQKVISIVAVGKKPIAVVVRP